MYILWLMLEVALVNFTLNEYMIDVPNVPQNSIATSVMLIISRADRSQIPEYFNRPYTVYLRNQLPDSLEKILVVKSKCSC